MSSQRQRRLYDSGLQVEPAPERLTRYESRVTNRDPRITDCFLAPTRLYCYYDTNGCGLYLEPANYL